MKAFNELSALGQVRRLRKLASKLLPRFGLGSSSISLIQHGENTTFRVKTGQESFEQATSPYIAGQYLFRIHRPCYQNHRQLESELLWLLALNKKEDLTVPQPVASLSGQYVESGQVPGINEPRYCSLLNWMKGRFIGNRCHETHFKEMGRLTAKLHRHALEWRPGPDFSRHHWDEEGLFGNHAGLSTTINKLWTMLPEKLIGLFREIASKTIDKMQSYGKNPDVYGLIHCDLHMGNILFHKGQALPLDFDDCGYGYWIYDLAVILCEYRAWPQFSRFRRALLTGYSQERQLPTAVKDDLDLWIAARFLNLSLWYLDMARIHSEFRKGTKDFFNWVELNLKTMAPL